MSISLSLTGSLTYFFPRVFVPKDHLRHIHTQTHIHTAVNPKVVDPNLWHCTHLRYTLWWGIAAARYDVILEAFQPHLLCSCHKQDFCHHASPARHWGLLMIWKSKGLPQCCESKAPRQSSSMRDKRGEKPLIAGAICCPHLMQGLGNRTLLCQEERGCTDAAKRERERDSERECCHSKQVSPNDSHAGWESQI